ncbi:MAG: D-aminoacylase, partial [Woeseiaceae bacterium]|nr:D-aminoacylase [Woeseiaceae bacterium]
NVRIVDGSGGAAYDGQLRIVGDVIDAVGKVRRRNDDRVVDGRGLVVAPGFIDTHSHADSDLFGNPDALAAVSQGITTAVVGLDGSSPYPLRDFVARYEQTGAAINLAAYAGHNTLRDAVMGEDFERGATDAEIRRMQELLAGELAAGALGLSTGLEYDPGIHASTAEVVALAETAADAGGRYISHIRSEDRALLPAIEELLEIGRVTGMPVQISHLKLAMKTLWGSAEDLIDRLDAARREGIDVTADVYPYEYWQSTMMVLLPERDPGDLEAVRFALQELAPPEGMWFTQFEPNRDYVGMTLAEIAALRESDPVTTFSELALEALAMARETGRQVESIIGTSMREADIETLLAWEHTNICSDGSLADGHPRGAGSFPRVLGRYVRERELFSLETAVHKMSGLAADHMGFVDRGRLVPGARADLVLFDPETVIDRATAEEPSLLSVGIEGVWVGGVRVYENGAASGERPGRFIPRRMPR